MTTALILLLLVVYLVVSVCWLYHYSVPGDVRHLRALHKAKQAWAAMLTKKESKP